MGGFRYFIRDFHPCPILFIQSIRDCFVAAPIGHNSMYFHIADRPPRLLANGEISEEELRLDLAKFSCCADTGLAVIG